MRRRRTTAHEKVLYYPAGEQCERSVIHSCCEPGHQYDRGCLSSTTVSRSPRGEARREDFDSRLASRCSLGETVPRPPIQEHSSDGRASATGSFLFVLCMDLPLFLAHSASCPLFQRRREEVFLHFIPAPFLLQCHYTWLIFESNNFNCLESRPHGAPLDVSTPSLRPACLLANNFFIHPIRGCVKKLLAVRKLNHCLLFC